MPIEKKDIEEVGEAVEALGVMVERELHRINLHLDQLTKSLSEVVGQEKNSKEEISELKNQIQETREFLEAFQATVSRTESRITELQRVLQDEEDPAAQIRNDLLIIKRDLQFVRSDLKEILDHREHLDEKIRDFDDRIKRLENERLA
jgi:chromosome segregation ATPase